jgi:hypothetical protein
VAISVFNSSFLASPRGRHGARAVWAVKAGFPVGRWVVWPLSSKGRRRGTSCPNLRNVVPSNSTGYSGGGQKGDVQPKHGPTGRCVRLVGLTCNVPPRLPVLRPRPCEITAVRLDPLDRKRRVPIPAPLQRSGCARRARPEHFAAAETCEHRGGILAPPIRAFAAQRMTEGCG